jgi:hypothetical protein
MAPTRSAIAGALLTGPIVLGFFSGGYFDRPRLIAGIVAWVLVVTVAIVHPRPWPRRAEGWVAIGALAALAGWAAVSIGWTPVRDVAVADVQRLALFLGVLIAAIPTFRDRPAARAAEPVLALGILAMVLEGLSERLLPGLFSLQGSEAAPGRLLQPLTYWNAMGLLAGIGVILCLRIAGDPSRPRWMRGAAAGAGPALAVGGYLTLSRGAILAVAVGLVVLALLQPLRTQLRALAVAAVCAAPAVLVAALLDGVRALEGSAADRRQQGLLMLGVLVLAGAAAAFAVLRDRRSPRADGVRAGARRGAALAAAVVGIGVVVAFGVLLGQRQDVTTGPNGAANARLASAESIRGDFWRVARGAFADEPLRGVGSGGFAVAWLRERPVLYATRDAHSLYLETAAELGVVGLALLLAFLGAVAVAARRACRLDRGLVAGPVAVLCAWAVHAGLDWDWEMPSLALVFVLLAALVVARAEEEEPAPVVTAAQPAEPAEAPRRAEVTL